MSPQLCKQLGWEHSNTGGSFVQTVMITIYYQMFQFPHNLYSIIPCIASVCLSRVFDFEIMYGRLTEILGTSKRCRHHFFFLQFFYLSVLGGL